MAIDDLMYRFSGNPRPSMGLDVDRELEMMIDKAGRGEVFRRAKALGWHSGQIPPKWVWKAICADIEKGRPSLRKTFSSKHPMEESAE